MNFTKIILVLAVSLAVSTITFASDNIVFPESLKTAEKGNHSKLYSIIKLDVFDYFGLNTTYNTDLQKNTFRKTPEYSEKYKSLQKIKSDMFSESYFVLLDLEILPYDVKKRGFEIEIGSNSGRGTDSARAPKSYEGFLFEELSTKTKQSDLMPIGIANEFFFLPMTETEGLKIETNRDDAKIIFQFKVSGTKTVKYKYYCWSNRSYSIADELLTAKNARVIIANVRTGEVYYNQAMIGIAKEKPKKRNR